MNTTTPPYPIHPICLAFPPIPALENQTATEDVREHGLIDDIVLLPDDADNGVLKVLDGRHRQQWCIDAGVVPRYRLFGSRESDGKSPVDFAYSVNTSRRHLPDTNVRAAIAAGLQSFWRQQPADGEPGEPGDDAGAGGSAAMGKTAAIEKAAAAMDVSPSSVRKAVDVLEHGEPGEFEKLQAGAVGLDEAAAAVQPKKKAARARKVNPAAVTASNPAADQVRRDVAAEARKDCGDELADAIEKGTLATLDDLSTFHEMTAGERADVTPLLLDGINLTFARKLLKKVFDAKDKIGYLLARAKAAGRKFVVEIDGFEITVRKAKPAEAGAPAADPPAESAPPAADAPKEKKKRGPKKKETAAADSPPPHPEENPGEPAADPAAACPVCDKIPCECPPDAAPPGPPAE